MKKGLKRATELEVRIESRPDFTSSWHPYSHEEVLDAMGIAVGKKGLTIVEKNYSLIHDALMFAAWEVKGKAEMKLDDLTKGEFNFGIGIVNSINKTSSVAISAFRKVFICNNFCFNLQHTKVVFRRHTGRFESDELTFMAERSVSILVERFSQIASQYHNLKNVKITSAQASLLTLAASQRGIINPTHINSFFELYQGKTSKYKEFFGTMNAWYGAATELMKDMSFFSMTNRQDQLNYFIDFEAPLLLKESKMHLIDFEGIRNQAWEIYKRRQVEIKHEIGEISHNGREEFRLMKKEKKYVD